MAEYKSIAHYRKLPYTRQVDFRQDGDEAYFIATIKELPSLRIDGPTREDALWLLDQMFDDFIRAQMEWGEEIPEPEPWPQTVGAPVDPRIAVRFALVADKDASGPENVIDDSVGEGRGTYILDGTVPELAIA